jgi:hypothetical protein
MSKEKCETLRLAVGLIGRPAMDYLWTEKSDCEGCSQHTSRDFFTVIHGNYAGVGAPFFVAPFMKRASTKGKIPTNGIKGDISMCQDCHFIRGEDNGGRLAVASGYQSIPYQQ